MPNNSHTVRILEPKSRKAWAILAPVFCALLGLGLFLAPSSHAAPPAPIASATVFDVAASSAADVLTSSLTPSARASQNKTSAYRVTVCLETTDSVFNVVVEKSGGDDQLCALNTSALTAEKMYTFTFGAHDDYTYNFQCATTTRIKYLLVEEIRDGAL